MKQIDDAREVQRLMVGGPVDGEMIGVWEGYKPNGDGSFRKITPDVIQWGDHPGEYIRTHVDVGRWEYHWVERER